jgi:CubicO group peptidase (beta-lactamase class C family)
MLLCWAVALRAATPITRPEQVGLSSERLKRIEEDVQRHIAAGHIAGAVTLVARRHRVVHLKSYGVMDVESSKPMSTNAIFRIASMTKPLTATAILMLAEDGKLKISDRISAFIPEYGQAQVGVATNNLSPSQLRLRLAHRDITIKHLLTHTSGIVTPVLQQEEPVDHERPTDTLADHVPRISVIPLDFEPGTKFAYSRRAGFDILGRVVEVVSGMSLEEFFQRRIFAPLGMTDTFFWPTGERLHRVASIYKDGLKRMPNQNMVTSARYLSGSGGLFSTAEDYLKFAEMLLNNGKWNGRRLLAPRTIQLMTSNQVGKLYETGTGPAPNRGQGWGLGVRVVEDSTRTPFEVSNASFGWIGVFGTQFWVDPKEKLITMLMIQTLDRPVSLQLQTAFHAAAMQAVAPGR